MKKSNRQFEAKISSLKLQLSESRAEGRQQRQRISELEASREKLSAKVRDIRAQQRRDKRCKGRNEPLLEGQKARGHRYDTALVRLCMCLHICAGCSYRGVIRVLLTLRLELGLKNVALPQKSSMGNWSGKMGYHAYSQAANGLGDYCLIVDESMSVGKQRLLLFLAADAQKVKEGALCLEDTRVLGMEITNSATGERVASGIEKVQEKVGHRAQYILSDGGRNLCAGIRKAGALRICDVGHETARLLQGFYGKKPDFLIWQQALASVKSREVMKDHAYLLPPKQRTVARFLNLCHLVDWSKKMLSVLPGLSASEKQAFAWLKTHQAFVEELSQVYDLCKKLLALLKNEGLSRQNLDKCLKMCEQRPGFEKVPLRLLNKFKDFFQREKAKIPDEQCLWWASSDVLESLFGIYKDKKSPNPLHGVTAFVLSLCLHTNLGANPEQIARNVKEALESISMADLATWKTENLLESQAVRRKKAFKK